MFPWDKFFPFQDHQQNHFNKEEFQDYMKETISNSMSGNMSEFFNNHSFFERSMDYVNKKEKKQPNENDQMSNLPTKVFESHTHVYTRITIKEKSRLKQLKVYHTSNQLIISGIPTEESQQKIILPALVKKKGRNV